jgi:hypothetical protein
MWGSGSGTGAHRTEPYAALPTIKRQPKSFSLVFITTNHFLSLEENINVFLGIVDPCLSIAIKRQTHNSF